MQVAYFNEIDPFASQWLGNLFPASTIDVRSIKNVAANDLVRFNRCHFFSGIGGWELALQLAGWPDNRHVWTGSCPCQPYSSAGKGEGDKDARNLWPDFFRLIRERRPDTIFGEQVASAIGHGWLDGIQRDLEGEGYAVGHCVLGAHSVGAPHIRQRLYWVADNQSKRLAGVEPERSEGKRERARAGSGFESDAVADTEGKRESAKPGGSREGILQPRGSGRLGIASVSRLQGHAGHVGYGNESGRIDTNEIGPIAETGAWADSIAITCTDGRSRRISAQPGDEPLAYGIPVKLGPLFSWLGRLGRDATPVTRMARLARRNRTGRLRGYGNAIVSQVAAEFIRSFMEATGIA